MTDAYPLLPMSGYAEALVGIHPRREMQEWVNSALESWKRYLKERTKMYALSLDKHSARASMSSPDTIDTSLVVAARMQVLIL
jgi:hypothetical protein